MRSKRSTNVGHAVCVLLIAVSAMFIGCSRLPVSGEEANPGFASNTPLRMYWIIPDGLRADPDVFAMYKWASEGKLPNIKKLMSRGAYGYSQPVFPSHTPVNFATLLTGTYPDKHGIVDGPMHIEGKPLDKVAIGGFRSTARKRKAIWSDLEEQGERVAVISVPGSTPPELEKGIVVRGRWGNWGPDYAAINFEQNSNPVVGRALGNSSKLFFFGPSLTRYINSDTFEDWTTRPTSYGAVREVKLDAWGTTIFGVLYDGTNDGVESFDRLLVSLDRRNVVAKLELGELSDWLPVVLAFSAGESSHTDVPSHVRVELIRGGSGGDFRIRVLYDVLNSFVTKPAGAADVLKREAGPMLDFPDNFPHQLIHYPEDRGAFLKELDESSSWHTRVVSPLVRRLHPSVVIHDLYDPNQMLTSRWWMSKVDPQSQRFSEWSEAERGQAWNEVLGMYQHIDALVGQVLSVAEPDSYIVLSSDHGNIPLDRTVRINNLLAQHGLLRTVTPEGASTPVIDWKKTTAVFLNMCHIYINPHGLDGPYQRSRGPSYESLRRKVVEILRELKDENGVAPVDDLATWEEVKSKFRLSPDRAGDIVIAARPGYGWSEETTPDQKVIVTPLISGYKQAIIPQHASGLLTPFMVVGPGVKSGYFMGNAPIKHVDQYPTVMRLLGHSSPADIDGKVVDSILDEARSEGSGTSR
jgi:predicted AlkP superfamily phosphohydrolase/phosphomutase